MSEDKQLPPCPFCGEVPEFKGEPLERDDRRYFVFEIPCGCYNMEIWAGDWKENSAAIAKKNWREQKG